MIDEIVNEVSAKTGMSPDQARAAVDAVLGFLQSRLPEPFASGLGSLMGGQAAAGASAGGGIVGGLEGLLEGKGLGALEGLLGSKS
jgi:hypothetical protein